MRPLWRCNLPSAAREPIHRDICYVSQRQHKRLLRSFVIWSIRRELRIELAISCARHRGNPGALSHLEETIDAPSQQTALMPSIFLPTRFVRDTASAIEGPSEVHQASLWCDSFIATVPTETVGERGMVLLLALAVQVQQISTGSSRGRTWNVALLSLPVCRPVQLRYNKGQTESLWLDSRESSGTAPSPRGCERCIRWQSSAIWNLMRAGASIVACILPRNQKRRSCGLYFTA